MALPASGAPAPIGPAAAAEPLVSGNPSAPFGAPTNPIFVTSAFPTPVLPRLKQQPAPDTDEHPLAIDKLLPPSRFQKLMEAARLSPTGGRSKTTKNGQQTLGQQTLSFPKASAQSSASTRVRRNSKGKSKDVNSEDFDHLRYVRVRGNPEPLVIVDGDSDDSDYNPGRSYPKALSADAAPAPGYPKTRSTSGVQTVASTSTTSMPAITITTPSTIAPAVVIATTATAPTVFQTPPNKKLHLVVPQPSLSPSPTTEYQRLVQDALKTPASAAGSAKRLELIKEALASQESPSPSPSPSNGAEMRRLHVEAAFTRLQSNKPAISRSATPLTFPVSRDCTPGPSTNPYALLASQVNNFAKSASMNSGKSASPETDYGLDSEMDAAFLEEASVFLDQGYTLN